MSDQDTPTILAALSTAIKSLKHLAGPADMRTRANLMDAAATLSALRSQIEIDFVNAYRALSEKPPEEGEK